MFGLARAVTLVVVSGLAIFAVSPAIANEIELHAHRDGDAIVIKAAAFLDVNVAAAWRVLTDYERYPAFIPDLRSSKVIGREGGVVTLDQEGDVRLLWMRLPMRSRLSITETPQRAVESRQLTGTMQAFAGRYELELAGDRMRLIYTARLVIDPEQRSLLDRAMVQTNAKRHFVALVTEIERAAKAGD